MSSVNLIISRIDNQEEMKQFLLSEAEYMMRDVDFDIDYALTVKVSARKNKKKGISYRCEIKMKRPGVKTHWKVSREGNQCYVCVRSASRSFKSIVCKHRDIEMGSAFSAPLLS